LGRPSKYTDEFKRDAMELVRSSGRSINDMARELEVCHETLRNWVRKQIFEFRDSLSDAASVLGRVG
jgi:transposase